MSTSERTHTALAVVLACASASCLPRGDCLRNSDCSSTLTCSGGKCVVQSQAESDDADEDATVEEASDGEAAVELDGTQPNEPTEASDAFEASSVAALDGGGLE